MKWNPWWCEIPEEGWLRVWTSNARNHVCYCRPHVNTNFKKDFHILVFLTQKGRKRPCCRSNSWSVWWWIWLRLDWNLTHTFENRKHEFDVWILEMDHTDGYMGWLKRVWILLLVYSGSSPSEDELGPALAPCFPPDQLIGPSAWPWAVYKQLPQLLMVWDWTYLLKKK